MVEAVEVTAFVRMAVVIVVGVDTVNVVVLVVTAW